MAEYAPRHYLIGALHYQGAEVWLTDPQGVPLCSSAAEPFVLVGRVANYRTPPRCQSGAEVTA